MRSSAKKHVMPHTIFKAIRDLQKSEDYAFSEIPMPYDLTIQAKGAGTKEVEYTVVPARQNSDLTPVELANISKKRALSEVHKALKEKEIEKSQGRPYEEPPFDPDEVPI